MILKGDEVGFWRVLRNFLRTEGLESSLSRSLGATLESSYLSGSR